MTDQSSRLSSAFFLLFLCCLIIFGFLQGVQLFEQHMEQTVAVMGFLLDILLIMVAGYLLIIVIATIGSASLRLVNRIKEALELERKRGNNR